MIDLMVGLGELPYRIVILGSKKIVTIVMLLRVVEGDILSHQEDREYHTILIVLLLQFYIFSSSVVHTKI